MSEKLLGYKFIKQIGLGAHSRISHAIELKTGLNVAVKQVVRNVPEDDRFIEQVETEYAVSHALEHPHLRHSHSIHRVRSLLKVTEIFLVMDFIDGLTLEVARPNRLNTFLTLFRRVANGLDALHESGWVHSDIKPINIMIARGGNVKIIDFGQSCRIGQKKERIQGTPDYIAPEQVHRQRLDQRTDIFNLGATMYWVLTSENFPTAMRGDDARGVSLTSTEHPVAPVELNDKIPPALSKLVMECCSKHPQGRPAEMKEVGARLEVVQKFWSKHRENARAAALQSQSASQETASTPDAPPSEDEEDESWVTLAQPPPSSEPPRN